MYLLSMRSGGNWLTRPFKVVSISELAALGEERRIKREVERRRKLRKLEEAGKRKRGGVGEAAGGWEEGGEVMMLNEYENGSVSPGMWIVQCCFSAVLTSSGASLVVSDE